MKYCRKNCRYLKPTEEKQTKEKESHICENHGKRVYHGPYHPKLIKLDECS